MIKAPQTNAISALLSSNNVSLMANKGNFASRKSEDTKVEAKKKVVVREECRTLFLQNNMIPSIEGMANILVDVMWNQQNLLWIDLSNNHL